jgi:VWFA-related protein
MAVSVAAAQQPSSESDFTLHTSSELVLLDVGVQDSKGASVAGLTKDNFRVYDDGKLQQITQFESEELPVTIGLVIDESGSMDNKRADVISASLGFIRESNPRDEMFVVNFNDTAKFGLPPDVPFTADIKKLGNALSMTRPEGRTALHDALIIALNHLKKGQHERKTLVLVSDGGDNTSVNGLSELMRVVQESQATIYTIGIYDEDDPDRNPGLLRRLANISGGEMFLPQAPSEIPGICRHIAREIRSRYILAYRPVRDEKGGLHKLKIVVTRPSGQKLNVHARTSYALPAGTE